MHVQHKSEHSTQYHWVFEEFLVASGIIKAESMWCHVCVCVHTYTCTSSSGHPGAGVFLGRNQDQAPGGSLMTSPACRQSEQSQECGIVWVGTTLGAHFQDRVSHQVRQAFLTLLGNVQTRFLQLSWKTISKVWVSSWGKAFSCIQSKPLSFQFWVFYLHFPIPAKWFHPF